jgi:hypothetical protein
MKAGDLVSFNSRSWLVSDSNEIYKHPGIILDLGPYDRFGRTPNLIRYTVMWADKVITDEHEGYLQLIE